MGAATPGAVLDNMVLPGGVENKVVDISEETIALVRQARAADETRAITTSTGLVGYDLHKPAQIVAPVFTPIVNSVPREMGVGIDVHYWKSITKFGWQSAGPGSPAIPGVVDENQSPSEPNYSVAQFFNVFQTIGAGNSVSFKAAWRGKQLEGDMKAKRMAELIFILKIIEEQWLCYYSDYLWKLPAPMAPTTAATGGTVAAGTYFVGVTAMSANGETLVSLAPVTVTTTGSTSVITFTFFTQPLASGYNVYVGTSAALGSLWRQVAANLTVNGVAASGNPATTGAITQSVPNMSGNITVTVTALTTSGNNPPANHAAMVAKSAGNLPLTNNGILALIFGSGNAAYTAVNAAPSSAFSASGQTTDKLVNNSALGDNAMSCLVGQPAAPTGKLAYSDITNMLLAMFQNARANPDFMAVSPLDNNTVTNLLYNATGTRVNINAAIPDQLGNLTLGARVTQFLNPTTGKIVQVEIWPYLPQGTIVFGSRTLPYPVPGFDGPAIKVLTNIDYYGIDYPPTKTNPQYSFADYTDEVLQISFMGGWAAITGIIPG